MNGRYLLDTNIVIGLFAGDEWLAAIAFQHNLMLVTQDEHFAEVEGLQTEKW
jgi:predicted nucleic acid-binding protein